MNRIALIFTLVLPALRAEDKTVKQVNSIEPIYLENQTKELRGLIIALQEAEFLNGSDEASLSAINDLKTKYGLALEEAGKSLTKCLFPKTKIPNTKWLKDAEAKFGLNFLKEQVETIKPILVSIQFAYQEDCLGSSNAKLIYDEEIYIGFLSSYYNKALLAIEKTNDEFRKRFSKEIDQLKLLLPRLGERPSKEMLLKNSTTLQLVIWEGKTAKPQTLVDFLNKHPGLKPPLDPAAATDALDKFLKK